MQATTNTSAPRPGWFVRMIMVVFRIALLTVLFTGLGMALGLFVGIVYTVLAAAMTNTHADLMRAVHSFAIPAAVAACTGSLLWNVGRAVHGAVRPN